MNEDNKMESITTVPSAEKIEEPKETLKEDPQGTEDIDFEKVAKELESKTPSKPKRTKEEEIAFNLKKNAERAIEAGLDPKKLLGLEETYVPSSTEFVTKEDMASQYASTISSSPAQAKVIMWHYRHTIQRTGNIHEDVDNAALIANKGKIRTAFEEIERGKVRPPRGSEGTAGIPRQEVQIPELPREITARLTKVGYRQIKPDLWQASHNQVRFDHATRKWVEEKIPR